MMNAGDKLSALRERMKALGVQGFLLPVADEFLGEYVPDSAKRLEWLTGFTGSAGLAVVLADKAAFFTDGRYTIQARVEVDGGLYTVLNSGETKPETWIKANLGEGVLGYDAMLHSMREVERLAGISLKAVENPIDALWKDRPAPPSAEAFVHEARVAGVDHAAKRAQVGAALKEKGADAAVLVASDSINWLLNIRGKDLAFTPVVLAYAVVDAAGAVSLYVDEKKIPEAVRLHLGNGVAVLPVAALKNDLAGLKGKRVLLDTSLTPSWFAETLKAAGAKVVAGDDPCQLPKAIKNSAELKGIRAAHGRDGLGVVKFLHWLSQQKGEVSELAIMERLLAFRREAPEFVSQSFETIAGSGPNGAIVHYRATQAQHRALKPGELLLLDSGAQYADGTTDITRTVAYGTPQAEPRERFTRVLKGHIALASARFPKGTSGSQLDSFARAPLWEAGLDYDHGTGHGVGCFLSVHEGPQRIGKRGGDVALAVGMILSNEPGYYKEGAYGIRIENLVTVVEAGVMENGAARFGFETLTLAPIDRVLVEVSLLSAAERAWLDDYHARVLAAHGPKLGAEAKAWLEKACAPLGA